MSIKVKKQKLENKMNAMKREIGALYFAYQHEDTPFLAKLIAVVVVAYALSPIDLIPDFIPVLGYLDDLILLPMGIGLAIKLIPADVMEVSRIKAKEYFEKNKKNWFVGVLIISLWSFVIFSVAMKIIKMF